jgi:hypothetical protein
LLPIDYGVGGHLAAMRQLITQAGELHRTAPVALDAAKRRLTDC